MKKHSAKGFSLIELLVALAVVAILASVAYPSYREQARRSNRSDGKATLMEVMQAEERNYTANQTYTTDLTLLGYANPTVSDNAYYTISAAACAGSTISSCVILTATPSASQAADGVLTFDSRGQKLPADKW